MYELFMQNIWIQLILTIGGMFAAFFAMFRYFIQQSVRREKTMLEYFETKNGHLERISTMFSKAIDRNSRALNKLIRSK